MQEDQDQHFLRILENIAKELPVIQEHANGADLELTRFLRDELREICMRDVGMAYDHILGDYPQISGKTREEMIDWYILRLKAGIIFRYMRKLSYL